MTQSDAWIDKAGHIDFGWSCQHVCRLEPPGQFVKGETQKCDEEGEGYDDCTDFAHDVVEPTVPTEPVASGRLAKAAQTLQKYSFSNKQKSFKK